LSLPADELHKRVVIVDTSNEIGGDGDVPHPAIGGARRMQVPDPSQQHKVMVSAGQLGGWSIFTV
jgi:stage III sporulation protein SpoIIIAA